MSNFITAIYSGIKLYSTQNNTIETDYCIQTPIEQNNTQKNK
jgi:hypothetical protein